MAKIFMYVWLLGGIALLAAAAGMPTGTGQLISALGIINTSTWTYNSLWQSGSLFGNISLMISAAAVLTTIIMGLYTRSSQESSLVANYVLSGALFGWIAGDIASLIYYASTQHVLVKLLSWLILVPMLLAYFIALVQWWRGNDI